MQGILELFGFEDNSKRVKANHTALDEKLESKENLDGALECDYETDCSPLYKNIEEENWPAIAKFLETGYWPGSFFADAIPPSDQVRTWVTRFDVRTKEIRWSQLPLHLAIVVNAPYEVIGTLIELFPQAVRCTDDQHMLPLHLAMRHGSSDNVVDLLLAAFPEGVNAKGKNDRTPIDCAIRGPNKVRGRILGTFVERAKAKATKSITNNYTREIASIQAQLDEKEKELGDVKSKLESLDNSKVSLQMELSSAVDAKRKAEEREIQAQITSLEKQKRQAREEELNLMEELADIKNQLSGAASTDNTKEEVERLKVHITEEILKADGAAKEELRSMKVAVEELHRAATFAPKGTADDAKLKSEVEKLREELQSMEDTTKAKVDIAMLKEDIESMVDESTSLNEMQVIDAKKTLSNIKLSDLANKPYDDLLAVKHKLEALKRDVKDKRLADKTSEDVVRLRQKIDDVTDSTNNVKTKKDLFELKRSLDRIKIGELSAKTEEELAKINKDIQISKLQLHEIEELIKLRDELTTLKNALELEVESPTGKAEKPKLVAALKQLKGAKIHSKTKFELLALKSELEFVQDDLRLEEEKKQTKKEIVELKSKISKQLSELQEKTEEILAHPIEDLKEIQRSLDAIDLKTIHRKSREEISAIAPQVSGWKNQAEGVQIRSQVITELADFKKVFKEALSLSRGNSKELKKLLEQLSDKDIGRKPVEHLSMLKTEAFSLSVDLKEKESVFKDLETIKRTISELLEKKKGKQRADLLTLEKTVDAIDLTDMDTKDSSLWDAMKHEIATLKKELENVDIAEKTKNELANLKTALEVAIAESEEKTKNELQILKDAVETIDTSKLDSGKHKEWEALKEEVDALKKELKAKECEGLLNSVKEKLKAARGLPRVEAARIKKIIEAIDTNFLEQSLSELSDTKGELQSIATELSKEYPRGFWLTPLKLKKAVMTTSKAPGIIARLAGRRTKKSPTSKGPQSDLSSIKGSNSDVNESQPVTDAEQPRQIPVVDGEAHGTTKVEGANTEKKSTEASDNTEETPAGRTNVETSEGAQRDLSDEKKDDSADDDASARGEKPSFPSGKPPLSPTKRATTATPTTTQEMADPVTAEYPMARTNSRTVATAGGEVEAVVVE